MKYENSLTGLQEPIPGPGTETISNVGHAVAPSCHKVDSTREMKKKWLVSPVNKHEDRCEIQIRK